MLPRTGIDGAFYAIKFEMRMPLQWNGRFFYQANGGLDGNVVTATGPTGGGGPTNNALNMGFAVISSDSGHTAAQNPSFGIDPQARLDYGYQAALKLTSMAKSLIQQAYGRHPDRSYYGGCSNGGRQTLVAASRLTDQYDGYLVGDPGLRLPMASIANMLGARVYASLAGGQADISTGFSLAERQTVANAVLAKCDALDGLADGLVSDTVACQRVFDFSKDVPTCAGPRDGSCLSEDQKSNIGRLFSGVVNSKGEKFYASFPFDAGIATTGWANWKFRNSLALDPSTGIVFQVPPKSAISFDARTFALTEDVDTMLAKVAAVDSTYSQSALSFMQPVDSSNFGGLRDRGAKMIVYHGTSDPIFSSDETVRWYKQVDGATNGQAAEFARLFLVPGMNHCSGGPATDQFDMLTPLVDWVERGVAPDGIIATARGVGNPGGANPDVPPSWSPARTRLLCPVPKVAYFVRGVTTETADSFECR